MGGDEPPPSSPRPPPPARAVLGLAPREPLPLPLFERPRPPPPIPVLLKAGRLAGVGRVLRTAFAGPDLCAVLLSYLAVVDPDVVLAVCRLNLAVLRLPWQVWFVAFHSSWCGWGGCGCQFFGGTSRG